MNNNPAKTSRSQLTAAATRWAATSRLCRSAGLGSQQNAVSPYAADVRDANPTLNAQGHDFPYWAAGKERTGYVPELRTSTRGFLSTGAKSQMANSLQFCNDHLYQVRIVIQDYLVEGTSRTSY
jgi:hypothetical protein